MVSEAWPAELPRSSHGPQPGPSLAVPFTPEVSSLAPLLAPMRSAVVLGRGTGFVSGTQVTVNRERWARLPGAKMFTQTGIQLSGSQQQGNERLSSYYILNGAHSLCTPAPFSCLLLSSFFSFYVFYLLQSICLLLLLPYNF